MLEDESDSGHVLDVGKTFETIALLKETLSSLALMVGFEFMTLRSSDRRYEVKCKGVECNWHVYARAVGRSSIYRIRNSQTAHECYGIPHRGRNNMTSTFIAGKIREKLTLKPDLRPVDLVKDIKSDFGVDISYRKAWKATAPEICQEIE